jgi:phage-related protein (TIGR01555 family)
MSRSSAGRRRSKPNEAEGSMGLRGTVKNLHQPGTPLDWFIKQQVPNMGRAMDQFVNTAARTGYGSPNLFNESHYELVRFSYNYWDLITLYRNHWISRRIVDVPAQDMIRAWPRITSDVDPKATDKINRLLRKTMTKQQMMTGMQWGRLFGGAGALIVVEGQEDCLDEPLDVEAVPLGGYKGLIPFDRWAGIMPGPSVCTDIARPADFARPETYEVRVQGGDSFEVHSSRILRFTGPEVPTPEREAQSWWGISVLEPVYDEIKKRDNMSMNILQLTFRANLIGMQIDDLAQLLSGVGLNQQASRDFYRRMEQLNHLMSNQSLVMLPKDGSLQSTQYTFGGLSDVYQQFQLDISGAAEIPVTRLWGRTITGLGQSNDADERIYEENIATKQEREMRPQLDKLYPVLCMSELGMVPDDLDLVFPSVRVLDESEKSELAKSIVDTVTVALNSGAISPRTYAQELKQSSDVTGIFTNITDEDLEKLSDETTPEDSFGEAAGSLNPAGSPREAISETNKMRKEQGQAAKNQEDDMAELYRTVKAADALPGDGPANGEPVKFHDLTFVCETPKGHTRMGKGWAVIMPADYGYLDGLTGADGDSLDAYMGLGPSSGYAYVVDQRHVPGEGRGFDEHKVMLNYPSAGAALADYKAGHHRASEVLMDWTPIPVSGLAEWARRRNMKKPAGSS